MNRIYLVGDSYSIVFLKYFKYIQSKYIKTHILHGDHEINLSIHADYIRKLSTDTDTKTDIKTNDIQNMIKTINSYHPEIMIYNFGQVDVNFLYFYNKIYDIPYDTNIIMDEYVNIIQHQSKNCKKVYVVNILPLFVDDMNELISEFVRLYCKDLHTKFNQKEINKIFDIEKYRKHLYTSNKLLKNKINDASWNAEVVYVDFNKYIYEGTYESLKKNFYIRKVNIDVPPTMSDFHINGSVYMETLLQNNVIPELNEIINSYGSD